MGEPRIYGEIKPKKKTVKHFTLTKKERSGMPKFDGYNTDWLFRKKKNVIPAR